MPTACDRTRITQEARDAFDLLMVGGNLNSEDPAAWGSFAGGLQEIDAISELPDRRRLFRALCEGPDGYMWQALGAAEVVAPAFEVWTAKQLLTTDFAEPTWVIPELLPAGLTILAGRPKVGKSWLGLQTALSVVTGGRALGRSVQRGPILYLALEDPPRRLRSRMRAQGWPIEADADFLTLGDFAQRVGDLRRDGGDRLALKIQQRGYRLVVMDTLSRAIHGDQNDAEAMTAALTPLQETAHEHEVAILMIDHHRKSFGKDPDAIADILGSTAKGAMLDTSWGLYRERGKAGAKLQVVGRDVVERTMALHFDVQTSCWQSDGDADELELTERRQEIIDTLAEFGPIGVSELARAINQDKANTHRRLQDLVGAGLVVRRGNLYAIP